MAKKTSPEINKDQSHPSAEKHWKEYAVEQIVDHTKTKNGIR